jgi:hypothetical protein
MSAIGDMRAEIERVAERTSGGQSIFDDPTHHEMPGLGRRIILPSSFEDDCESFALERVCKVFSLTAFEKSLLLLCAGVELVPDLPALCAAAHGDPRLCFATFGLAIAAFADAEWNAFTPSSTLRRWRLIEVGGGERLTSCPLRTDERILQYLLGVSYLDERLFGIVEPCPAAARLSPSQKRIAEQIARAWSKNAELEPPLIQLCGSDSMAKRSIAVNVAAVLGMNLREVRAADLPTTPTERDAFARLWEREALLSDCALLIDEEDSSGEASRGLLPFVESTHAFLLVMAREPLRSSRRRIIRLEIERPSAFEQRAFWEETLGPTAEQLNGHLDQVVTQFDLSLESISSARDEALQNWQAGNNEDLGSVIWQACRRLARPRLDDLAQRISPAATWKDLVLPPTHLEVLRSIATHVRWRALVYDSWGFARKGLRGLGISALFSGASGTGKTMAAEVVANELALDLYRIDLSAVVSKYIGETERNLRRVFDAAEEGGAILLFDEADALFGKRSEVKDSHDRYANIEVSYLLQRIEAYRGLAILTSNLKNALDPAFMRRIRFIVHFPFPDSSQRVEIWRRIFPDQTPTEGLNLEKLSQLNLSGGNIRNLALGAAFLAADSSEPVRMKHLAAAARGEYAKLEKPLSENDLRGWV